MVKDKVWLSAFSFAAAANGIASVFMANPLQNGILAVTFALLAIAWAPRA